jgi:hypothetical protein
VVTSSPRSDAFLQTSLTSLTHSDIMILLTYLVRWLGRYWRHNDRQVRLSRGFDPATTSMTTDSKARLPNFGQVRHLHHDTHVAFAVAAQWHCIA